MTEFVCNTCNTHFTLKGKQNRGLCSSCNCEHRKDKTRAYERQSKARYERLILI